MLLYYITDILPGAEFLVFNNAKYFECFTVACFLFTLFNVLTVLYYTLRSTVVKKSDIPLTMGIHYTIISISVHFKVVFRQLVTTLQCIVGTFIQIHKKYKQNKIQQLLSKLSANSFKQKGSKQNRS